MQYIDIYTYIYIYIYTYIYIYAYINIQTVMDESSTSSALWIVGNRTKLYI